MQLLLRSLGNFTGGIVLFSALAFRLPAAVYVAPNGIERGPGTKEQPFASLRRACDAARNLPPDQRVVVVRGGRYENVSLVLGPADSGLTIEAAPGERPELFGGQPLHGWKPDGEHFFSAPLPPFPLADGGGASQPTQWEIRMLSVNGSMRPRARYPQKGRLTHLDRFNVPWMSSTGGGWKRPPTGEELTHLHYRPGDLGPGFDVRNAEVTVFHMWDESCVGVASNDTNTHTLTFSSPTGHPPGAFGVHDYVIWNTREGMLAPGQWYHDRTRNRVVYWPLANEDMSKAEVMVPTRTTIIAARGERGNAVRGITVRGLQLSVTTVPLLAAGFGAARYEGAITLEGTENCRLEKLLISQVGGHGLSNRRARSSGTWVADCDVTDCGAGGICIGGSSTVITNNRVARIGLAYPSAIGIFGGGDHCRVSHNEVHDCSYSAINYGGAGNIIDYNQLYHCMQVLHDGGAIYVFAGRNCVLRHNFAHDILDTGGYGASAYYLDERSEDCVVEDNVSLRVNWPSHNHMATNNIIRSNIFIADGDAKLTFPRSSGYLVDHNVFYAEGAIRIQNPDAVSRWNQNLFFSRTGVIEQIKMNLYSSTGIVPGAPPESLVADPKFRNWRDGDFRFEEGSPAARLGVEPIDVKATGVLGR